MAWSLPSREAAHQKGRADAAKGVYHLPGLNIFDSGTQEDRNELEVVRQCYNEGWEDKKREMREEGC